ncbi:hypothetical protein JXA31_00680 [Candidatus Bathyarchaeota archaeon]|nr:hypothetical protein [Candidatus Bathyarchaeota archaeon]
MDKVRLLLTLITIAIVVVPIVGMVLAYQGNLLGLFIPPEINEIADDLTGGDGDNGSGLEAPTMVGEPTYDEATRTFSVSFQYKNTFHLDITIKSLTGNIECDEHRFPLGNASLSKPVSIDAGETGTLTVLGTWTEEAIDHFENMHAGEEMVDVVLVDFAVDISGIQLQMDQGQMEQSMQVPNPAP